MTVQKAAISVSEMARTVGLSRARFYELVEAGTFPPPVYFVATRRPVYVREQQDRCLGVKRSGVGADGRPVLFYTRKPKARRPTAEPKRSAALAHSDILAGVVGLGLTTSTAAQVEETVRTVFPAGTAGVEQGDVVRAVFLHLVRQSRA